jgi:hypothetical protein
MRTSYQIPEHVDIIADRLGSYGGISARAVRQPASRDSLLPCKWRPSVDETDNYVFRWRTLILPPRIRESDPEHSSPANGKID